MCNDNVNTAGNDCALIEKHDIVNMPISTRTPSLAWMHMPRLRRPAYTAKTLHTVLGVHMTT